MTAPGATSSGSAIGRKVLRRPPVTHLPASCAFGLLLALARLRTPRKVALLHYAPVSGTIQGEPAEIFAYLGTSRLEEPLNRYPLNGVFHGHANHVAHTFAVSHDILREIERSFATDLLQRDVYARGLLSVFACDRFIDEGGKPGGVNRRMLPGVIGKRNGAERDEFENGPGDKAEREEYLPEMASER